MKGGRMRLGVPTLPTVMLSVYGVWMIVAGLGTLIPKFVHDRFPRQFVPVSEFFFTAIGGESPDPDAVRLVARVCQWIIGPLEVLVGVTGLMAAFASTSRLSLANFSLGLGTALFGAFLLVMFIIHDKALVAWNQYPAISAWIGVTWLVVVAWEKGWMHRAA